VLTGRDRRPMRRGNLMRSARLLLAVPAATALVFTGISPAWAGGDGNGHHHDDDDVRIVEILRVEITDDDEAEVYFTYKCDEDTDDLEAEAKVWQNGTRYEGREDVKDCKEDEKQEDSVTVEKKRGDSLDADEDAKVTVTLYEDDDEVDEKTDDDVDVEDDDDDKDHHDHHDNHHSKVA
jgi:hypothetical protein